MISDLDMIDFRPFFSHKRASDFFPNLTIKWRKSKDVMNSFSKHFSIVKIHGKIVRVKYGVAKVIVHRSQ